MIIAIPYKIVINLLIIIVDFTSNIPFSKVYIKTPYTYQIILYYILVFIIAYFNKFKLFQKVVKYKTQIIAVILIVILIPNISDNIPKGKLQIYFIDVGQGDSCLFITPENKKLLIDGGGSESYDIRKKCITSIFTK